MYCAKCGAQNGDGAIHCIQCGGVLMAAAGQPQSDVAAAQPKTCGLAIASMVMGLLCLTCILWPLFALPAVICGIVALVKISKNKPCLKGTGLAITGIVIPAMMTLLIPVIALLLAIMMPAVSRAKVVAERTVCMTNLSGLSTAMMVYRNDYDNKYPTPEQWCNLLMQEADVSPKSFQCPEDPEGSFSYAINENVYKIESGSESLLMVVLFEAGLGCNGVGGPEQLILRHNWHGQPGCNIGFADGHAEFVSEDRIAGLQWTANGQP